MIVEGLENYLETLAEHVFDTDKLVTYKWLSKDLQVHVNVAKQILWEFWQRHRENKDIECTYLLIGVLDSNSICVEVVKGFDLSKAKQKFNKIISEHIYSIHKPLSNIELLATSGAGDVSYSAIKCDACIERSDEEMHVLRWGIASKKDAQATVKSITEPILSKNSAVSATLTTDKPKLDKKPITVKKNNNAQKNGFNNFFGKNGEQKIPDELAKSSKKNKDKGFIQNLVAKKESHKSNSIPSPKKIKKSGLDNFFEKGKKQNNIIFIENTNNTTENTILNKNNDVPRKQLPEQSKKKDKETVRGKKRNHSKEVNNASKRRKRIVLESDSSDSEVLSDSEIVQLSPSPEPITPAKAKSPSPPRVKQENGKRKVLKLINKTYKEGEYIVTKKEHVYVSCSEDEAEEKEPPKVELKTEVKVKKKQTTLTNFFKKS